MNPDQIDILIEKTVTSRATVKSLMICFSSLVKKNPYFAKKYLCKVCEISPYMGMQLINQYHGDTYEEYYKYASKTLLSLINDKSTLNAEELLAVSETSDHQIMSGLNNKITKETIINAFSLCSEDTGYKLMGNLILYFNNLLNPDIYRHFYHFVASSNGIGRIGLIYLLHILFNQNTSKCNMLLTKLITIIGTSSLEETCGEEIWKNIRRLLTKDCDELIIWYAYLDYLNRKTMSSDDIMEISRLIERFCPIQNNDLLAYQALNMLKTTKPNEPIMKLFGSHKKPTSFSRNFRIRFEHLCESFYHDPYALADILHFLDNWNPYNMKERDNNEYPIIKQSYFKEYEILQNWFAKKTSIQTIIYNYLSTPLYTKIPIEYLLEISEKQNAKKITLEEINKYDLWGIVIKRKNNSLIIQPKCFFVLRFHEMLLSNLKGTYRIENGRKDDQPVIHYQITAFEQRNIHVREVGIDKEIPIEENTWDLLLEHIMEFFHKDNNFREEYIKQTDTCSSFSYNMFGSKYDLLKLIDLLLDSIKNNSWSVEWILPLFYSMEWNIPFTIEGMISPKTFSMLTKYTSASIVLFKKLFSSNLSIKTIVELYMKSIFKAIIPLQTFLVIDERTAVVFKILRTYSFTCSIQKKETIVCWLRSVKSAPICSFSKESILSLVSKTDMYTFAAKLVDYVITNHEVTNIIFSQAQMPVDEIGIFYGFVSRNEHLNSFKISTLNHLPNPDFYVKDKPFFFLKRMEEAFYVRRNTKDNLLYLLSLMKEKNPFYLYNHVGYSIFYLKQIYSKRRREMNLTLTQGIILNLSSSTSIYDIFFNTTIRYYLFFEELIELIKSNRPELFEDNSLEPYKIQIRAYVDQSGMVWNPFFRPGFIIQSPNIRNSFIDCTMELFFNGQKQIIETKIESKPTSNDLLWVQACIERGYLFEKTLQQNCLSLINHSTLNEIIFPSIEEYAFHYIIQEFKEHNYRHDYRALASTEEFSPDIYWSSIKSKLIEESETPSKESIFIKLYNAIQMIIDKQPFDMVLLVINNIRVFLSSGFFVHQFGYDPILKYKIIVAISSDRNASQIKLENASMLFTNQYQEEMSDFSYRLLSKSQYFDAVNKTIESMKKDNASLKTFICKEIIYFLQNSSEQNALSISSNILSNYRLKYGREKSLEDAVKDIISYYCICVHEMYLSYPREVILRTGLETINLLSDNEYCKESRRIIIEFTKRNDKSATYRYILNMFRTAMEYRSLETCIKLTEFALNEFGNKYGIRSELAHKIFETLMDVLQRELLKHSNNLSINNISEEESLIEGFDIRDMEVLMEKYPRNDIYASVLQNLSLALRQMSFSQCSKIFINVIRECNTKYGRNPEFDLKIIKLLNDSIL